MQFDVVLANPPFQDRTNRKRTPHKLWIDFTHLSLTRLLRPGGLLLQISPASFRSPSSRLLREMRSLDTQLVNFDIAQHFPQVGSSFAYYAVRARARCGTASVTAHGTTFSFQLDDEVRWLPADLCKHSLNIHRKVMWSEHPLLDVRHDYVTCHNIRLGTTLSKTATEIHRHPVFHTNAQTWFSSERQDWADQPKVLWTRSGYTRPFFDPGTLGGTDMVYYVLVEDEDSGRCLEHNINLPLMRYILRSARWSGFGNEIVFHSLPALPTDRRLSSLELCERFALTEEEVCYVQNSVG